MTVTTTSSVASTAPEAVVVAPVSQRPLSVLRRFRRQRAGVAAAVVVFALIVFAIVHPLVWPDAATDQVLDDALQGPSWQHWLGTDEIGRDLLSRVAVGIRTSLVAAALAAGIGLVLGAPAGILAGYVRSWPDAIASRASEAIQAFPPLILAMAVVAVAGRGLGGGMAAIGVVLAPRFFRICRATAMRVRQESYIEAAQLTGARAVRVVRTHVVPNIVTHIIVQVTLALAIGMLAEAALSFLGLGLQPPAASLGSLLNGSSRYLSTSPYLMICPGAVLFVVVFSLMTIGEALRRCVGSSNGGGRGAAR